MKKNNIISLSVILLYLAACAVNIAFIAADYTFAPSGLFFYTAAAVIVLSWALMYRVSEKSVIFMSFAAAVTAFALSFAKLARASVIYANEVSFYCTVFFWMAVAVWGSVFFRSAKAVLRWCGVVAFSVFVTILFFMCYTFYAYGQFVSSEIKGEYMSPDETHTAGVSLRDEGALGGSTEVFYSKNHARIDTVFGSFRGRPKFVVMLDYGKEPEISWSEDGGTLYVDKKAYSISD